MLTLREYDFIWKRPDSRRSDQTAYFEVPDDVEYALIRGTAYKVIVPAKAVVATDASKAIDTNVTTSDVSNATVDGVSTPNTISFKLPFFKLGNNYSVDDIVQIVQYTGGTSYTNFTYTSGSPSNGQWTYNSSTNTFTIGITDATSVTFYIYYAPTGGQIKVVHKITGATRTENTCAVSSTNEHILYAVNKMEPRIQVNEVLESRTFLEVHVYPRTINGTTKYSFDPLLPDSTTSTVVLVEMPVERV